MGANLGSMGAFWEKRVQIAKTATKVFLRQFLVAIKKDRLVY